MKKNLLRISAVIGLCVITAVGIAQVNSSTTDDDDKKKKRKIEKKIEVEDKNGVKTVKVTTIENGEKTVESYEGAEADAYLKKMEKAEAGEGKQIKIEIDMDSDNSFNFEHDFSGDQKSVEVSVENGVKTVTVKTTDEDGNEKVEVYEGEEAEEYLKNEHHGHMHHMHGMNPSDMHMKFKMFSDSNAFEFDGNFEDLMNEFHAKFDSDEFKQHMEEMKEKMGDMQQHFEFKVFEDGEELPEFLEEILEEMDISKDGEKRISMTTMVIIEDVDNQEGVEKLELESFNLYPNPTTGQLSIKFSANDTKPINVVITDVNGKQVHAQTVKGSKDYDLKIDLEDKANGTHIVSLVKGDKQISKKIILNH